MSWGPRSADEGPERTHSLCADCGWAVSEHITPLGGVIWTHDPIPVESTELINVPDDAISTGAWWHVQHRARVSMTLQVRGLGHMHSGAVHGEVIQAREQSREICDAAAVTIAAWWQSPGSIGHVLATFASGLPVTSDDLIGDIVATMANDHPGEREAACLDALASYAMTHGTVSCEGV